MDYRFGADFDLFHNSNNTRVRNFYSSVCKARKKYSEFLISPDCNLIFDKRLAFVSELRYFIELVYHLYECSGDSWRGNVERQIRRSVEHLEIHVRRDKIVLQEAWKLQLSDNLKPLVITILNNDYDVLLAAVKENSYLEADKQHLLKKVRDRT